MARPPLLDASKAALNNLNPVHLSPLRFHFVLQAVVHLERGSYSDDAAMVGRLQLSLRSKHGIDSVTATSKVSRVSTAAATAAAAALADSGTDTKSGASSGL